MSRLSKFSGFPPAGPPSWALGDGPVWRGGSVPGGWWPNGEAWYADFQNDRYMRSGAQVSRAALLSCTRSSTALAADAAGAVHAFGPNEVAIVDGGAGVWGQFTQLLASPLDFSVAAWNKSTGFQIEQKQGYQVLHDISNSAVTSYYQTLSHPADTKTRTAWILVKKDANSTVARGFNVLATGGSTQSRLITFDTSSSAHKADHATASSGTYVVRDLGYAWLLVVSLLNNGGNTGMQLILQPARYSSIGAASTSGSIVSSVDIYGAGIVEGNVFPPFLAAGTRPADDIRASSFGWFFAAGLQNGATVLAVPNWTHVGDGISRPLFEYSDGTAANFVRAYIDATDKPRLKIVSGNVMQADVALTATVSAGRMPLAFGWSAEGGYVVDDSGNAATFGAIVLPTGLSQKRIGGSVASNFLNDRLEQLCVSRPLPKAEAQSWVSGA